MESETGLVPPRPVRWGGHPPAYLVAKDLEMTTFPASLFLVSEPMAAGHFDQIYEFTT